MTYLIERQLLAPKHPIVTFPWSRFGEDLKGHLCDVTCANKWDYTIPTGGVDCILVFDRYTVLPVEEIIYMMSVSLDFQRRKFFKARVSSMGERGRR